MVKVFLVRDRINISTRADIGGLTNRASALMEEADAAIDFCNLDVDPTKMQQHMRALEIWMLPSSY